MSGKVGGIYFDVTLETGQMIDEARRKAQRETEGDELKAKLSAVAESVSTVVGLEPFGRGGQTCGVAEKDFDGYDLRVPEAHEETKFPFYDFQSRLDHAADDALYELIRAEKFKEYARLEAREEWENSKQITASPAPAPAITEPTPMREVSQAPTGTSPLTTNEIANCFAEFKGWSVRRWKDELGSPDKWLKECQERPGTRGRGGAESTWWPLQIAVELVRQDPKIARALRARFKRQEPLKPWLDALEVNIPDDSDSL